MTEATEPTEMPVNPFVPVSSMVIPVDHYWALLGMAGVVRDLLAAGNAQEPVSVSHLALHHGVLHETEDGETYSVAAEVAQIWDYLSAVEASAQAETEDEVREAVTA